MSHPDPATPSRIELPSLVAAATAAAQRADSRATKIAVFRTVLLIAAAAFGAITITQTIGKRTVDWSGWAVLVIFVALLGLRFFERSEDKRDSPLLVSSAIADLSLSQVWRYVTRAKSHSEVGGTDSEEQAGDRLLDELKRYQNALRAVTSEQQQGRQITPWMKELRASNLQTRIDAYLALRVKPLADQAAREDRRRGRSHARFFAAVLVIELVGIPLGALKAQNLTSIDWIGVLSAAAASLALLANSMRLNWRQKVAQSKTQVLNFVADQIQTSVKTESDWAVLVTKVEDHLTLDAEAALASDASPKSGTTEVARHTMTPEDYFRGVDHLKQQIWGGLGGPILAPDVIIALNPGGAIVGGILYFSATRAKFVPLTLRAGMKPQDIQTYLRSVEFSPQKTAQGTRHLVVLVVDASIKSGNGMAEGVGYVREFLEQEGWQPHEAGTPSAGSRGVYTLKTAVITQSALRPGEKPRVIEADFVHDTTTKRFPYGTV